MIKNPEGGGPVLGVTRPSAKGVACARSGEECAGARGAGLGALRWGAAGGAAARQLGRGGGSMEPPMR